MEITGTLDHQNAVFAYEVLRKYCDETPCKMCVFYHPDKYCCVFLDEVQPHSWPKMNPWNDKYKK